MIRLSYFLAHLVFLCGLFACGGRQFTLAPVKTFDPDNRDIAEPKDREENQVWDIMDMTFFYQIEKVLDLNWTARKIGKGVQITGGRPADNVNVLDEVPESSWFSNRHYRKRMTLDELKRGPNTTSGPDQSGPWTITAGKFEGGSTGFTIKDARGDRYILKFDPPLFQEMGSSAEVISTKFLYACGYNVPENSVVYFDPTILQIGATAKVVESGFKRPMTPSDLNALLEPIPRRSDGKMRTMASKFVDGKPVGVWNFIGRRRDDPNDLVHHEHRRELRGLRTISSWLSDEDRRAANTLAVYTRDALTGNRYVKHYLIDMGSTLGSNNIIPHSPKYGNEYVVDPRTIGLQLVTLGLWTKPWEFETGHLNPRFTSIGYYEAEIFDPGAWYPTYPNPAFEYATLRDAFWGAKIVMAFDDADIRAIVEEAHLSDAAAQDYMIATLIARRDKIGRHWFDRMNPLDKFVLSRRDGETVLTFHDLAIDGALAETSETRYLYTFAYGKKTLSEKRFVDTAEIVISKNGTGVLDDLLQSSSFAQEADKICSLRIRTQRRGRALSKEIQVHFYYAGPETEVRIVGVVREE